MIPSFITAYWGKAQPRDGSEQGWHPLAYHSIDVAATLDGLLGCRPQWLASIAEASALSIEECRRRLLLAAMFHDLGKFAENFQQKVPHLRDRLNPNARVKDCSSGHGEIGHVYWNALIEDGSPHRALTPWLLAAFAHHGTPTPGDAMVDNAMSAAAFADAQAFIDGAISLFGAPSPAIGKSLAESWRVAGLVMLADWVGSNQTWFPYATDESSLPDYWDEAKSQASRALREAGLAEAACSQHFGLTDLFGTTAMASPLQDWAERERPGPSPTLYILEDLTGAGKTEAALILAHRLMKAGRAEGLYWALPTMATANGLYRRLADSYRKLFVDGEVPPSLVLAHGAADLNGAFQASLAVDIAHSYGDTDLPAEAHCAAFFAEDRKKTFLAQVGIGTLDQALLAVLPVRHQAMRLAGLSRRVLVVDEAHAFDDYMTAALERLLTFHAKLGGSAIILSATLTRRHRERFAKAFTSSVALGCNAFPLATRVGSDCAEIPIAPARGTRRDLPVRRFDHPRDAMAALLAAAAQGGCGVYIRNTVKDALEAVDFLRAHAPVGVDVDLFHARFALGDRLARENAVLARFGKDSTKAARQGQILVATQVVEQSLDLDFDFMVSDLCPMDLLIQRAGRLHRHDHRPARPAAALWLVGPPAEDNARADWYSALFPTGQYVYPDVGQLWRTQKVLSDVGGLPLRSLSPRALIEPVFGEDALELPAALADPSLRAEIKRKCDRSIAQLNVLKPDRFDRQAGAWDSDTRTPTRLGELSITIRLGRWDNGRLAPWSGELRPWRMSEMSLRASQFSEALAPCAQAQAAIDAARQAWGMRFDPPPILALVPGAASERWQGTIKDAAGRSRSVSYSAIEGLRIGE
jgi:CRISPR-associated endonuclease/helicase Cas3